MSSRIVKLLIILLLSALISYIFYLNPDKATVNLGSNASWTLPMALVLIGTFFCGVLVTAFFAFLVGVRLQLQSWKVSKRYKQAQDHHQLIAAARGELALKNLPAARGLFKKVVAQDPEDIEARVLLAETHRLEGDVRQALGVLEEARVDQKKNVELLLMAAELNETLGNHTAAFDNAAMVLKLSPKNTFALRRLVQDCQRLKRFDEALSYQEQLLKLVPREEYQAEQDKLAEIELQRALKLHSSNKDDLRRALEGILKRHREFTPARAELAALECDSLNFEQASKLWSKAFAASDDPRYLERMASMWIHADDPSKAVATTRNALNHRGGKQSVEVAAHIFFINLLLRLEMLDEARKEFDKLSGVSLEDEDLRKAHTIIKARLLKKDGKIDDAVDALLVEIQPKGLLPDGKSSYGQSIAKGGPPLLGWKAKVRQKLMHGKQAPPPNLPIP